MSNILKYEIQDKINEGYYTKIGMEYPKELSKAELEKIEKEVTDVFVGTLAQIKAEVERKQKAALDKVKRERTKYRNKREALVGEFKQHLFIALEVENNEKAELCYQKADAFSDGGLSDILDKFESLVELIKPSRVNKIDKILKTI